MREAGSAAGWRIDIELTDMEYEYIKSTMGKNSFNFSSWQVQPFNENGTKILLIRYNINHFADEMGRPLTHKEFEYLCDLENLDDRLKLRGKELIMAIEGVRELSEKLTQRSEQLNSLQKEIVALKTEIAELKKKE